MPDYRELMALLAVPRPNGSAAERATGRALRAWLDRRGIPYRVHAFRQYPYFFEAIGLWLIASRTALALAIWLRWAGGLAALPIALVSLVGGTLDVALNLPVVAQVVRRQGENLLIEFGQTGEREIVLSAHYDTKTEPLDHHRRMFLVRNLPTGIVLTLVLGLLGPVQAWLAAQGSPWADPVYWLGVALTLPMLGLAWALGLNLSIGRLLVPSQGAVDNGAACAVLLGLAERLAQGDLALQRTKVTIALFTGEEANMQGSRAYARSRAWPAPAIAVNLEIMAQDGDYVFWEQDGNSFGVTPTSPEVNALLRAAVEEVTGQQVQPAGPVNSDGASFIAAGVPTAVLGTRDARLGFGGLHRPADNLGRVVMQRLPEGVQILSALLRNYDRPAA